MTRGLLSPGDVALSFMGVGDPEVFRCRVYGVDRQPDPAARAARHEADVMSDATGQGFIEAPAYDATIADLVSRGWLRPKPCMVPVDADNDRLGRYAVWLATALGRSEWGKR